MNVVTAVERYSREVVVIVGRYDRVPLIMKKKCSETKTFSFHLLHSNSLLVYFPNNEKESQNKFVIIPLLNLAKRNLQR